MSTYGRIKIAGKRIPKIIRYLLIYLLAISIPASMVPLAMTVMAQTNNPAPVQLFYVTLPEQDGLTVLDSIHPAADTPMYTYFSIAIGIDGTYVYYDQWEDGYAADIANPSPAEIYNAITNPDGVQIWGNGKASDGVAPNIAGVAVDPTDANDVLHAGDVIIPYNAVPLPRVIVPQNYVRDTFASQSYSRNDGNTNWATNWAETGDGTTSPTSGDIYIDNQTLFFSSGTDTGDSISRGVNLSTGGTCATLSFDLTADSDLDATGNDFVVEVSSDGINYTILETFNDENDDGFQTYNISGYASLNTSIRFRSLNNLEYSEDWAIDNVQVSWNCYMPVLFDGKDKVGASSSISMARATWATGSDTLNAFAHEMYATNEWGTAFQSPVGTNTANAGQMFEYSALSIMACQNNTTVQIDADANGSYETAITLQEGGATLVENIRQGAKVLSDKPVQVVLMTGDIGSTYGSRDMNLLPTSTWGSSYWSPVGVTNTDPDPDTPTRIFVYNPTTNGTIYVTVERYGLSNITLGPIAPGGGVTFDLGNGRGAHVYASNNIGTATNDPIFAIGTVDTANTAYDWSFTLFPDAFLTTEALVGLGLGKDPTDTTSTQNGSPLWVTATCNTYIYVDWNNDGTADGVDTNGDDIAEAGSQNGILVNRLQSVRLFEPVGDSEPYDQSGARVWSRTASSVGYGGTPGCKLAIAWGEDPANANPGSPGLDVGTSVPPLRPIEGTKSLKISVDTEPYTVLNPGDTTTYTITIHNPGPSILENIYVYDTVPANTSYVQNTTKWNDTGVEPWILIPDLPVNQLPLSITGGYYLGNLPVGKTFYIQFDVLLLPGNYEDITNCVVVYSGAGPFTKCVTTPVATRDWGDLPDSYKTTAAQDGPRHSFSGLMLGTYWDVEVQGQPNDTATGDDAATSDDEDGVTRNISQLWLPETSVNLNIVVNGGPGIVAGWFDWNADGDITDPGEYYNFGSLPNGVNVVLLPIPAAYTAGASVFSRFRIFNPASLPGYDLNADAYYRYAEGGEVEDYFWELHEPAIDIQKYVWDGDSWEESTTIPVGGTAEFKIVVTNTGNVDLTDVTVTDPLAPDCELYIGDLAAGATYESSPGIDYYTGNVTNVTDSFTNFAYVTGKYGDITVNDDDPAQVVVGEISGAIGDFVWYDINGNGIQDSGEPGIGNVIVELYTAGNLVTPIATTNTFAADGSYLFTGLAPGDYVVKFIAPDNYDPTQQDQGTDDALDSDADTTTGMTATISLGSGETNLTIDAGFIAMGPAIDIQKMPDLQIIPSGGTAVFQIVVTNTGNVPLVNVAVTDPMAPDCAVTIGNLAVGASYSYSCSIANVMAGFTNVATVNGEDEKGTPVSDTDDAVVQVISTPAVGGEIFPTDKLSLLMPVILLLLAAGGAGFWLVKRRMSPQA